VGRDGCRTPLQWDATPNAGFCPADVEPWLPVAEGFDRGLNVAAQDPDPGSLLNLYRRLIRLRRRSPALREGRFAVVAATRNFLLYRRESGDERFMVAIGFGMADSEIPLLSGLVEVATDPAREGERISRWASLGKDEALVIRVE
jgi:alpha-glucosidase